MEDGLAEKLTSFRRILQSRVIDNNIIAEIYTEHNMSVIRDLTLCLQVTENRHVFSVLCHLAIQVQLRFRITYIILT